MGTSDTRVAEMVRTLLTRRWVDVQKLRIACFRGTVRITGEFIRLGGGTGKKEDMPKLDVIELEVRRLAGVERVSFELSNWVRVEGGEWIPLEKRRGPGLGPKHGGH